MKRINITKKAFVVAMTGLKKQVREENDATDWLNKVYHEVSIVPNENHSSTALINLLAFLMNDIDEKWIEHYVYELDFGKDNDTLKVLDANNIEIPMRTIKDLWKFLVANNKKEG